MELISGGQQAEVLYGVKQPAVHSTDYSNSSTFYVSFSHALAEIPRLAMCLYLSSFGL